jgi:probable selenium-dependent hydroxylase accessory protein YqeC
VTIVHYLALTEKSVIAVVGCGGKTSLIEVIADKFRDKKVLVTPTTKMFPMGMKDIMLCETIEQCATHEPQKGIQCMGLLNTASGKFEALSVNFLAQKVPDYDLTLLEADGSKGLPCKGWLVDEPVVPPFCTHTVGIVTMNALNMEATRATVHRLPEFLALTGLKEGQTITAQTLETMVCDPCGMFKEEGDQGRYLVVNQVEDDESASVALAFLCGIKEKYPGRFKRLLYGSVHLDTWQEA